MKDLITKKFMDNDDLKAERTISNWKQGYGTSREWKGPSLCMWSIYCA